MRVLCYFYCICILSLQLILFLCYALPCNVCTSSDLVSFHSDILRYVVVWLLKLCFFREALLLNGAYASGTLVTDT
jgi:hypothetical protein